MAPDTFHCFGLLPLELRRHIYLLATPSRIVHVKEKTEDRDEFNERFNATFKLDLDPSLTYFSYNWGRPLRRYRDRQPPLETFGFTGAGAPYQPWEPSAATPEFPLRWIATQPDMAWELMRTSYLYSRAPIPPLLHTCTESREELMSRGYQLAFRTRSHGPRTWFHFGRDVVYIKFGVISPGPGHYSILLSGCPWLVGQFHPEDLKKFRKVALENGGSLILPPEYTPDATLITVVLSRCLRIIPNIEELLLVEWSADGMRAWEDLSPDPPQHWWTRRPPRKGKVADARQLWQCVAVEEIDGMLALYKGRETELPSIGIRGHMLKRHRISNGVSNRFYEDLQQRLEQRFLEHRDQMVSLYREDTNTTWNIPKIKTVHILPPDMIRYLVSERQFIWTDLLALKRGLPGTVSDSVFGHDRWWAKEGAIPPPGCDIFLRRA